MDTSYIIIIYNVIYKKYLCGLSLIPSSGNGVQEQPGKGETIIYNYNLLAKLY